MILRSTGGDSTHRAIAVNNGYCVDFYIADIRERDYFDKESLAEFVSNLVNANNTGVNKEIYKNAIMQSVLGSFEIKSVSHFAKIYLN